MTLLEGDIGGMGGLSKLLLRVLEKTGGYCLFCELCYVRAGSGAGVGSELASRRPALEQVGGWSSEPWTEQPSLSRGLGLRPSVSAQAWSCATHHTA